MGYLLGHFLGALAAGTLLTALFGWVLGKVSSGPAEARYFFAFLLASGIAFLGWLGDGAPVIVLASSLLANAVGALVNLFLANRRQASSSSEEIEQFD